MYIYIFTFICMYVYVNRIYACIWYIFTTFEQNLTALIVIIVMARSII